MVAWLKQRWAALRDRRGQGLVEYTLILAVVVVIVLVALTHVGEPVTNAMTKASDMFPPGLS